MPKSIEPRRPERCAIFISHANPEDNVFTIWLGAKLAALGFEVWADVMRLHGGDDWQRKLELALRVRAAKFLFVATAVSVTKQGVRNEIQIASDVSRKIGDDAFIIPLRLEPFESPFLVAHAQYIDFQEGWARGLNDLIDTLSAVPIPRQPMESSNAIWRDLQLTNGKAVSNSPETLLSNWLDIAKLPASIRYYDFRGGVNIELSAARMRSAAWPLVPYHRGFLSFAPSRDLDEHFGATLPLDFAAERGVDAFLEQGWPEYRVAPWDARNVFADLARQAIETAFVARGLARFDLADRRAAWWAPIDAAPRGKISFRWDGLSGARQIQGASTKRSIHWHYSVSITPRTSPIRHAQLTSHIIFTTDGRTPLGDPARMHRARRSFAKGWRNARWRDMMLAFLFWLANGEQYFAVSVSSEEAIWLQLPPRTFVSPVSMPAESNVAEGDDDDQSFDGSMTYGEHDFEFDDVYE